MISIAINGAAGRMGRRLVALATEDQQLQLVAAIEHAGHSLLGQDAGTVAAVEPQGVVLAEPPACQCDVLIDFALPVATVAAISACVDSGAAMVIGTTGLSDSDHQKIDQAAKHIAILQSPNMSLAVNLMFALAGQVAKRLGDDYDIEITESHHRYKKDAPSGTAKGIVSAICDATGKNLNQDVIFGRHGPDVPRQRGQIAVHAMRLGDVVGEHTVRYATLGERLEIHHVAMTRDIFARGALAAARWIAHKPAGRYHMQDMLEI